MGLAPTTGVPRSAKHVVRGFGVAAIYTEFRQDAPSLESRVFLHGRELSCSEPEEGLRPAPKTRRGANVSAAMRRISWLTLLGICLVLAGCGGRRTTVFVHEGPTAGVKASTPNAAQQLGFPTVATKNTTPR